MSKYTQADDGKTVGGKIVVWIQPPAAEAESASSDAKKPELAKKASPAVAAKMAAGQAAALKKAAEDGKPFCEHCESARKKLAALRGA